jgi:membrane protein YdbS with pleckstrin-like domain
MSTPTGEPPERDDPRRRSTGDTFDDLFDQDLALSDEDTQVFGVAPVQTRVRPDDPPRIDPEELEGLHGVDPDDAETVGRVLPLEDEASHLVARYLFPTERYRGEWKKHLIHLTRPITVALAATLLLGWLSGWLAGRDNMRVAMSAAILLWVVAMGYLAWRVADWHFDRFILTNKRVMVVHGIITRRVAMMPLLRVTDMKYEQSPLGRILNYGTFVLESAGQDQALREVPHLPNPNELYLRVVEEMYEPAAVEARLGRSSEAVEEEDKAGDS